MKAQFIKNFTLGSALVAASLLSGCKKDNLQTYMETHNFPKEQIDSTMNATKRDNSLMQATVRQSAIDSMAYRSLFEGTKLAQNLQAVENFNKIAGRMRADSMDTDIRFLVQDALVTKADEANINKGDIDDIEYIDFENDVDLTAEEHVAKAQYKTDKAAYKKFFANHGLMKGGFQETFDSVSNEINPIKQKTGG